MPFEEKKQQPLLEGVLGRAHVTILGAIGLRLSGLNSFHLDEGPNFTWLNIYRVLANSKQLDITRERAPSSVSLDEGDVVVRWDSIPDLSAEMVARYHLAEEEMAVDVTSFGIGGVAIARSAIGAIAIGRTGFGVIVIGLYALMVSGFL